MFIGARSGWIFVYARGDQIPAGGKVETMTGRWKNFRLVVSVTSMSMLLLLPNHIQALIQTEVRAVPHARTVRSDNDFANPIVVSWLHGRHFGPHGRHHFGRHHFRFHFHRSTDRFPTPHFSLNCQNGSELNKPRFSINQNRPC